jgi:hypothetical protein
MAENTNYQGGDPGAVPGASTQSTNGKDKGIANTTELSSVVSAKALSVTHGKNGVSELEAIREREHEEKRAKYSAVTKCEEHGEWLPCGRCAFLHEAIPEEEEQPNDGPKKPPLRGTTISRGTWREGIYEPYVEESPKEPRRCIGIPKFQGPADYCDCVLGPEVKGDRCAICAGWMETCGRCDGCNKDVPGWQVTGFLCTECRRERQRVIEAAAIQEKEAKERAEVEDETLIVEGRGALKAAFEGCRRQASMRAICRGQVEAAWVMLSERSDLDPVTVALCKQLRDAEVLT